MARCLFNLGDHKRTEEMLLNALALCPHLRESYYELANLYYIRKQFALASYFAAQGLKIKTRPDAYMTEENAWNGQLERILELSGRALEEGE